MCKLERLEPYLILQRFAAPGGFMRTCSTLVEIQRIPHSDENLTIDVLEGINKYDANRYEIFYGYTHRWLQPRFDSNESHPDSFENEKA